MSSTNHDLHQNAEVGQGAGTKPAGEAAVDGQGEPGDGALAEALSVLAGLQADRMVGVLLTMALAFAVPMRICEILNRGGVDERDLARVKGYAPDLRERGADLFRQSAEPGGTGQRFNQVADLIAVLSFLVPGGVYAFGERWDAEDFRPAGEQVAAEGA